MKGFELIRNIHIDPVPFDMERDLITPTYKKKRPQMLKYYKVSIFTYYFLNDNIMYYHHTIPQYILDMNQLIAG